VTGAIVWLLVGTAAWVTAISIGITWWRTIRGDGDEPQEQVYDQELDGTDLAKWNEELR